MTTTEERRETVRLPGAAEADGSEKGLLLLLRWPEVSLNLSCNGQKHCPNYLYVERKMEKHIVNQSLRSKLE